MKFILTFAIGLAFYAVYEIAWRVDFWRRKRKYVHDIQTRLQAEQQKIVLVEYKGHKIPMTELEKKTVWRNLTTAGKKKALSAFKEAKKEGKI